MDDITIKTAKNLQLKPSPYIKDHNIPFNYQKRMVLLTLKRPRMIVGDDVGLGKTIEAIYHFAYMKMLRPDTKAIVFTEKGTLKQWLKEFDKFTKGLKVKIITAQTHPDPKLRISALRNFEGDVIITSYSMAYNYSQYLLMGMGKRFIVYADEPNYFKNHESLLNKKMKDVSYAACRAYGLTATVIENRLEEAYGIFSIIAPDCFESKLDFDRDFCIKKKVGRANRNVIVGYRNLDKFREQIEPYFYGRLQDDPEVEQELPELLTKDLEIELSIEQSKKVVEVMDRLVEMPDGSIQQLELLPSLIRAQQMVNDPKLLGFDIDSAKTDVLVEMLQNSLSGERVIVYSKLRQVIDIVGERLKKEKIPYVRITGLEKEIERNLSQEKFMSDGPDRCNVVLMTRAGLKGLNLQKGGHLIWYDLPWSYGHYRQGCGRIKRTGSIHKAVASYRFLATLHPQVAASIGSDQSIDHHTLNVLERKKALFNVITGDVTTIESSPSDLVDIMKEVKAHHRKGKVA